ncbi:MAG: DUF5692 family protein [[Clostridium] scindens]
MLRRGGIILAVFSLWREYRPATFHFGIAIGIYGTDNTNELARRAKMGGIFCFLIVPAALTVYFIAIYVGAANGAEWALNNPAYVHMNKLVPHYTKHTPSQKDVWFHDAV